MDTSSDLQYFLTKDYDYWGTPWCFRARAFRRCCLGDKIPWPIYKPKRVHVGNGGLSLQRVNVMIRFLKKYEKEASYTMNWRTDLFSIMVSGIHPY